MALREARAKGFDYTTARGFGSAAFLAANLVMGLVLARYGPGSVLIWVVVSTAIAAVAALALPPTPAQDGETRVSARALMGELGWLLRAPSFLLCLAAVGLIQATHGFYYGFSVLAWRAQGLGAWTGPLWATGTGAEILFMWLAEPWRRRLGADRLLVMGGLAAVTPLVMGGLAAVARWIALGLTPPLWLLFPLQALHALSFGATYLAALRLIERLSPPRSASAAQSLNSGLASGVLMGLATAASGPLFDAFGARGYFAMALTAGVGTLLALRLAAGARRT
jgi:PPP family 3-phenylpropionic acid transporter